MATLSIESTETKTSGFSELLFWFNKSPKLSIPMIDVESNVTDVKPIDSNATDVKPIDSIESVMDQLAKHIETLGISVDAYHKGEIVEIDDIKKYAKPYPWFYLAISKETLLYRKRMNNLKSVLVDSQNILNKLKDTATSDKEFFDNFIIRTKKELNEAKIIFNKSSQKDLSALYDLLEDFEISSQECSLQIVNGFLCNYNCDRQWEVEYEVAESNLDYMQNTMRDFLEFIKTRKQT